jgi:beta-lactamase class A
MMKQLLCACIACLLGLCSYEISAQRLADIQIPFNQPPGDVRPLRDLVDADMQSRLQNKLMSRPKWKTLIENKHVSIGLVDLGDTSRVRYAGINGNEMLYAASLPKIAILLAAMDAIEQGCLEETPEIRDDLRLMISKSDNHASTRMIDRLGYDHIEHVLTDQRYDLYDEDYGGGLWVGKRYAASGARHPDPIKGLSHAATALQVCRFYYLLVNGQLVNYNRSKQMLAIMERPELHHKFVNTLEKVAPAARLFRKSGSWHNYHSDSILVWGPSWRRYILVALTEDPEGEMLMRELVTIVEEVLRSRS